MKRFLLVSIFFIFQIIVAFSKFRLFTDPDPPYEEFVNEDLAQISEGVLEMRLKPNGEYGIFSNGTILKDSIILSIPAHGIITSFDDYVRSYYFYEMVKVDHKDFLLGRVLLTKFLVKFGFLYDYYLRTPYLQNFNKTVLHWSTEDFDFFHTTSGFFNEEEAERSSILQDLKNLREINEPFLDKYEPKFTPEMFEQNTLLWAKTLLHQKSFAFSQDEYCILNGLDPQNFKRVLPRAKVSDEMQSQYSKNGYALLPFFDLFTHENLQLTVPITVEIQENQDLIERYGLNSNIITFELDSFTNQRGFDLVIDAISPKSFRDFWVIENGTIYLKANRDYQPDEEVKYFKGAMNNSHLLRNFGYIFDDNFYSGVGLRILFGIFNAEEKQYFEKMKIATNDDLYKQNSTLFSFSEYQLNHRYVLFLRVYLMKVEELMPVFNETKHLEIIKNGRFKNAYFEMLLWFNYYMSIDHRNGFKTTILEDKKELQKALKNDQNDIRVMILKKSLQQKHVIYKHLFGAWSKWIKLMHHDITHGFMKKVILHMAQNWKNDEIMIYSERD